MDITKAEAQIIVELIRVAYGEGLTPEGTGNLLEKIAQQINSIEIPLWLEEAFIVNL